MNLTKIVFTGGPCAGKSTTIKAIKKRLENQGYKVFIVSETARELIENGTLPKSDYNYTLKFQDAIMKIQKQKEDIIEKFALLEAQYIPTVILYDRSIVDNRAYLNSDEDYRTILNNNNLKELAVLEKYDLVIHLISLAAVSYINYENDDVRLESKDFAKELDEKTLNAYLIHKNLKIVLPTVNQQDKIEIVALHINNLLQHKKDKNFEIINYSNLEFDNLFKNLTLANSKNIFVSELEGINKNYKLRCKRYNEEIVYEEIYEDDNQTIIKSVKESELSSKLELLQKVNISHHLETYFIDNYRLNQIIKHSNSYQLRTFYNENIELSRKLKPTSQKHC